MDTAGEPYYHALDPPSELRSQGTFKEIKEPFGNELIKIQALISNIFLTLERANGQIKSTGT